MNQIRTEIAYFMNRLYNCGLTTTSGGNISAKVDDQFITPSGLDKGRLTRADRGYEFGRQDDRRIFQAVN